MEKVSFFILSLISLWFLLTPILFIKYLKASLPISAIPRISTNSYKGFFLFISELLWLTIVIAVGLISCLHFFIDSWSINYSVENIVIPIIVIFALASSIFIFTTIVNYYQLRYQSEVDKEFEFRRLKLLNIKKTDLESLSSRHNHLIQTLENINSLYSNKRSYEKEQWEKLIIENQRTMSDLEDKMYIPYSKYTMLDENQKVELLRKLQNEIKLLQNSHP